MLGKGAGAVCSTFSAAQDNRTYLAPPPSHLSTRLCSSPYLTQQTRRGFLTDWPYLTVLALHDRLTGAPGRVGCDPVPRVPHRGGGRADPEPLGVDPGGGSRGGPTGRWASDDLLGRPPRTTPISPQSRELDRDAPRDPFCSSCPGLSPDAASVKPRACAQHPRRLEP